MFCNEIPTKNKKRLAHYSTKTLIHFLSRSTSTPIKILHPPNSFKCSLFHNRDHERKTSARIKEKNGSLSEAGVEKQKQRT